MSKSSCHDCKWSLAGRGVILCPLHAAAPGLLAALETHVGAFHDMVCDPARTLQECDNYRCVTGRTASAKAKNQTGQGIRPASD